MQLQHIKMIMCSTWVLAVFVLAMIVDVAGVGVIASAFFAFLPPRALMLLWNEPSQTMSESINESRR